MCTKNPKQELETKLKEDLERPEGCFPLEFVHPDVQCPKKQRGRKKKVVEPTPDPLPRPSAASLGFSTEGMSDEEVARKVAEMKAGNAACKRKHQPRDVNMSKASGSNETKDKSKPSGSDETQEKVHGTTTKRKKANLADTDMEQQEQKPSKRVNKGNRSKASTTNEGKDATVHECKPAKGGTKRPKGYKAEEKDDDANNETAKDPPIQESQDKGFSTT